MHDLGRSDDDRDGGQRAEQHEAELGPGEAQQRGRVEPVRGHEERRGPGVGGDASRHHALVRPGMATRARPPVGEVVGAHDQEGEADARPAASAGATARPRPRTIAVSARARIGAAAARNSAADEHHRHRHDDHGQLGGHGAGPGPLPADRQLGPEGEGEDEEAGHGGAERDQAPTGLVATIERLAAQPGHGETGHEAPTGDVEPAPEGVGSLVDLGHEQLGELLAVAGAPLAGIPATGAERRDGAPSNSWSVTPAPTSRPAGADRAPRCRVGSPGGCAALRRPRR